MGAGEGYQGKLLHKPACRRFRCDGHLLLIYNNYSIRILLERQSSPGTALLSSCEEGERVGSLNKAFSTLTCWLVVFNQLSITAVTINQEMYKDYVLLHCLTLWIIMNAELLSLDIAVLSEMRISGNSQFFDVGAGYTFFTVGHPEGKPRQADVGFTIKASLIQKLEEQPKGIKSRLLKLGLLHGQSAVFVSAYTPTMIAFDHERGGSKRTCSLPSAPCHSNTICSCLLTSMPMLDSTMLTGQRFQGTILQVMRTPMEHSCFKPARACYHKHHSLNLNV